MNPTKLIEIEQIYNFIAEYPGISSKSNLERVYTFISAYQNDVNLQTEIDDKSIIQLNFHNEVINLDLASAPNFLYKTDFINWCSLNLLQ